jgi:hypothetical protein
MRPSFTSTKHNYLCKWSLIFNYIDAIFILILTVDGEMCNEDLGMRDGSIQTDQIFASPVSKRNAPFKARPSSTGWCIDKTMDANPWIMV